MLELILLTLTDCTVSHEIDLGLVLVIQLTLFVFHLLSLLHIGTWDTFRTFYPLLALHSPQDFADIVENYVDGWRK